MTWRGNRGTSSSHAGFYSSQAALMALSSIYSLGTGSKRTRSGALASSTHLLLSKPIKESRKATRPSGEERIIFLPVQLQLHFFCSLLIVAIWTNSAVTSTVSFISSTICYNATAQGGKSELNKQKHTPGHARCVCVNGLPTCLNRVNRRLLS